MNAQDQQGDPKVIAAYQKCKRNQWIIWGVMMLLFLPSLILSALEDQGYENLPMGSSQYSDFLIPALLIGLLVTLANQRCPACSGWLGGHAFHRYCRHCGTRLEK